MGEDRKRKANHGADRRAEGGGEVTIGCNVPMKRDREHLGNQVLFIQLVEDRWVVYSRPRLHPQIMILSEWNRLPEWRERNGRK